MQRIVATASLMAFADVVLRTGLHVVLLHVVIIQLFSNADFLVASASRPFGLVCSHRCICCNLSYVCLTKIFNLQIMTVVLLLMAILTG